MVFRWGGHVGNIHQSIRVVYGIPMGGGHVGNIHQSIRVVYGIPMGGGTWVIYISLLEWSMVFRWGGARG